MPKLPVWGNRMFMVLDHALDSKLVSTRKEFWESLGLHPENSSNLKRGDRDFTVTQIKTVCEKYNINANWIFGLEPNMTRGKTKSAIQNLKDAVRSFEAQNGKKG